MGLFNSIKEMIMGSGQQKSLPPLDEIHCPICGGRLGGLSHNLEIAIVVKKCNRCDLVYDNLLGYNTNNYSTAQKCKKLGYKIYKMEANYGGGWTIRD